MVVVTLDPCNVSRALEIVHDMRDNGFQIDIDFVWQYIPGISSSWEPVFSKARFTFYNNALASWFRLKYE